MLKVHNGVTLNMDKWKVTALTLLDISAVLDTIDHAILIKARQLRSSTSHLLFIPRIKTNI